MTERQEERIVEAFEKAAFAFTDAFAASKHGPGAVEAIAMTLGGEGIRDSVSSAIRDAGDSIAGGISEGLECLAAELRRIGSKS
ncbi:MAG: hypothetical protein V3T08_09895 [Gemmatimonadota bacterium]